MVDWKSAEQNKNLLHPRDETRPVFDVRGKEATITKKDRAE